MEYVSAHDADSMSATVPVFILDSNEKDLSTDYVAVATSDWFRHKKIYKKKKASCMCAAF